MIPRILLIEDNPADVRLVQESLVDEGIYVEVTHARSAEDALSILERTPTGQLPDLVLMDLDLPKMSGRELLGLLKSSERMRPVPIVILTTSDREADVEWCYARGASAYVCKPMGYDDFGRTVHTLVEFYLRTVRLPSRSPISYAAMA